MGDLADINNSFLSLLPLFLQSTLKALPFSDYSLLIIILASLILLILWITDCSPDEGAEEIDFGDEVQKKNEKTVKVKILNTKKSRRGGKKKKEEPENQVVAEEAKVDPSVETIDGNWEQPKPKKPKNKKQE